MTKKGREPALQIFTDASWSHFKKGVGSWGAVLVWQDPDGNPVHELHGDAFREACANSTVAELQAAANGLAIAIAAGHLARGALVEIVSDNTQAVAAVNGKRQAAKRRKLYRESWGALDELAAGLGLELRGRWVKAHQNSSSDFDAQMNQLADAMAGYHNPVSRQDHPDKPSKAQKRKLRNAQLRAHGLELDRGPLRERAIAIGLPDAPIGSREAQMCLLELQAKFPAQFPTLAASVRERLQELGVDTDQPEHVALALYLNLHSVPEGAALDAQLGRFHAELVTPTGRLAKVMREASRTSKGPLAAHAQRTCVPTRTHTRARKVTDANVKQLDAHSSKCSGIRITRIDPAAASRANLEGRTHG